MKKLCLILLLAVAGGATLRAQTNAPAQPAPRPSTQIDSDSAEFDVANHKAVYHGNVRVNDPQMKLRSELLTVDLPTAGGRVNHIIAETNVVIDATDEKGQKTHATSDKAVYDYQVQNGATNETITLTGNAMVENTQGWLYGEPIIWNRANDSLSAKNQRMVFKQNLNGLTAGTNNVSTNKPAPAK